MTTPLEKISALESKLTSAIAARPGTIAALEKRLAEADSTLESFASNPATAQLDRALKAHTDGTAAQALLARLGETRAWTYVLQSQWTRENHGALCELLEKLVGERSASRQAFRDAAGIELGRLTTAIIRAEGNDAEDVALEALNREIGAIETDLAARETRLRAAHDSLRGFRRAIEQPDGGYEPVFRKWERARDAVKAVNFEISDVPLCVEKP